MKYLVKIWWEDEDEEMADVTIMSEAELIKWFEMSDCYPSFDYEIYGVDTRFKEVPFQIIYVGWQPENLIEFIDERGIIVVSSYDTDY